MDPTTERLARYAHKFELATLDAHSLHECRLRLIWPKGHALNRASDAVVEAKFIAAYEDWRGAAGARLALDVLWSTDRLPSAAILVDVLCEN